MAYSLTGQSTSLSQSEEASGTVFLSDYPEAMYRAQQLLFEDTMGPTDDLLSQGQMSNLNVQFTQWKGSIGSFTAMLHALVRKES